MPQSHRSADELQAMYSQHKSRIQKLIARVSKLESEAEEHKLVIETLRPLDPPRKCFHMINGVLVEKSIREVLPMLEDLHKNLLKTIEVLLEKYKSEDAAFKQFVKENNIKVMS
ncbi:putative prefoldin subunit 2 [Neolecta irregularis DAH-3]|uniref:Putative prefoldin subunit 2 n=1 Tax=Neolecta irregularis (strain DAH-3) TaxID=1198029 RepID=A0A1U7LPF5_NEOID|nr:putative prefoldin subunit 2 [Neolecta irregularis DAH-3]|eukprot:OLL24535.1 putative prefoldin subunit 2 [Neolecta irregularis DAH-3]